MIHFHALSVKHHFCTPPVIPFQDAPAGFTSLFVHVNGEVKCHVFVKQEKNVSYLN